MVSVPAVHAQLLPHPSDEELEPHIMLFPPLVTMQSGESFGITKQ